MTPRFDPNSPAFTRSLSDLRPKIDLLTSDQVLPIRYDIEGIVTLGLGVATSVAAYREAARAQLDDHAAEAFDLVGPAAQACASAHAAHQVALNGADVEAMVASLSGIRSVLRLEALALVQAGVLPAAVLDELKGGTGYRDLVFDVVRLTSVFRTSWTTVAPRTALAAIELDRAEAAANALLTVLGETQQSVVTSPTAELRRRAYTLFVRTYEEVRRAMTFLRWEQGDADDLVPPLGSTRAPKSEENEEPVATPVAPSTETRPGMPGAPALAPTT